MTAMDRAAMDRMAAVVAATAAMMLLADKETVRGLLVVNRHAEWARFADKAVRMPLVEDREAERVFRQAAAGVVVLGVAWK